MKHVQIAKIQVQDDIVKDRDKLKVAFEDVKVALIEDFHISYELEDLFNMKNNETVDVESMKEKSYKKMKPESKRKPPS